jgi:hypothetical protein
MRWLILALVAPTVALVVLVIIASLVSRYRRRQCPACLQKGLRSVSRVRATTVVDGSEVPDYRSYLRCDKCGARFKLHDGVLSGVPDDELADATRFG